jgi:hypothetical protein
MMGIRELFIVAVVALALYGRSGVLKSERFQSIWPWVAPVRRPTTAARRGRPNSAAAVHANPNPEPRRGRVPRFVLQGNRLYWFLTILAATAVAAWIVTRTLIASGSKGFLH